MPEYNKEGRRDLSAFVATVGTQLDPTSAGLITLANGTSYYVPLGNETSPMPSQTSLNTVQVKWSSGFAGTLTIETTNFPTFKSGLFSGAFDVSDYDATPGNWIEENPSTAYISTLSTDGSTGGATVTNATIVVAGGTAGGCMIHLGGIGSRRIRVKAAVTAQGNVRFSATGKNAA